jgi:Na+-transporting methylmalonyl-CoA/oxaloacetate decarboxylase gamma subunit
MQNLEFGLTLTVLGMGGTLLILYLIGLVVEGLKKVLVQREKKEEARG